jgi:hypothetical protein
VGRRVREPSPYAGTTQRLRADAVELGGQPAEVVDWYERTGAGQSWHATIATDPRAQNYAMRRAMAKLPDDDDVLFARVDGMGALVHLTEIDGVTSATPNPYGPKAADPQAVGQPCPACQVVLVEEDTVAVLRLGPGPDPQARQLARAGQPYNPVVTELHWACATGDDSYQGAEA